MISLGGQAKLKSDANLVVRASDNQEQPGMVLGLTTAHNWLKGHPESCRVSKRGTPENSSRTTEAQHEHGSARCISAFLGHRERRRPNVDIWQRI